MLDSNVINNLMKHTTEDAKKINAHLASIGASLVVTWIQVQESFGGSHNLKKYQKQLKSYIKKFIVIVHWGNIRSRLFVQRFEVDGAVCVFVHVVACLVGLGVCGDRIGWVSSSTSLPPKRPIIWAPPRLHDVDRLNRFGFQTH